MAVALVVPVALLAVAAQAAADRADDADDALPEAAAPTHPAQVVATPLLSLRRQPGVVSGRSSADEMVTALGALAADLPQGACLSARVGGAAASGARPDQPGIPASTLKVLTAAVALDVLGADHRFTTEVRAAAPAAAGRIEGDLWLVGGGDPLLATADYDAALQSAGREPQGVHTSLEQLADAVAATGVKAVTGAVRGDASAYDGQRTIPSWPAAYMQAMEAGPLSALLVDDGSVPGRPLGRAADPAQAAAARFVQLLAARGITVAGGAATGTAPATATAVASVSSAPLSAVVGELLTTSDNTTAELLLKEVGRRAGSGGSTAAGLDVVRQRLAAWGVPTSGLTLVDGSGLDRGNRMSCSTLSAVLARQPLDGPLVQGLAVAGRTGTLADQLTQNPVAGGLRAKTGTLSGVKALAGVWAPPGAPAPVAFALLDTGTGAANRAPGLWDRLGRALAAYPAAVDLAPFSPAPAKAGA